MAWASSEQWLHSVNSSLYRDVHISEAVAPLGALELRSDGYYHFRKPITQSRFERIRQYVSYVQILTVDERYHFIVRELSDWSNRGARPSKYPFPNLRSLKCAEGKNKRCWDMSLLMPPSLDHFSITAPEIPLSHFYTIYQALIEDRTELTSLSIYLRHETEAVIGCVPLIEKLLEKFRVTLTRVHIPEGFLSPSVICLLADIPDLKDLAIGIPDASEPSSAKNFELAGAGWGDFNSLLRFSFQGHPVSLFFFIHHYQLLYVTTFRWAFNSKDRPNIRLFFLNVSRWFPFLTSLRIGNSEMDSGLKMDHIPVLNWSFVRPVLLCTQLTEFSLPALCVSITRGQLLALFNIRPSWKRLELYTTEPFSFGDLRLFAEFCPVLTHLGIYFDVTCKEDLMTNRSRQRATFRYLESINFAYSKIQNSSIRTIGRYLYEICAKPPRVSGWHKETWEGVAQCIAELYVNEEINTGRSMSPEAKAYIEELERSKGMEVDSENEDVSEDDEDSEQC